MDENIIVSLSNRIIQDITEWTILPEQQLTSMPDSKPGVGLVLPPSDNHNNEETGSAQCMAAASLSGASMYTNCTDTDTKSYGDYEKQLEHRYSADFSISQCRSFASSIVDGSFSDLSSSCFLSPTSLHRQALSVSHQQLKDFLRFAADKDNTASVSLGNVVTLHRKYREQRSDDDFVCESSKDNNRVNLNSAIRNTCSPIPGYSTRNAAPKAGGNSGDKENSAIASYPGSHVHNDTSTSPPNAKNWWGQTFVTSSVSTVSGHALNVSESEQVLSTKSLTEVFDRTTNNSCGNTESDPINNMKADCKESSSSTKHQNYSHFTGCSHGSSSSSARSRSGSVSSDDVTHSNNSRSSSGKCKSKSTSASSVSEISCAHNKSDDGKTPNACINDKSTSYNHELSTNLYTPRVKDLIKMFSEGKQLTGRSCANEKPELTIETSARTESTARETILPHKDLECDRGREAMYLSTKEWSKRSDTARKGNFANKSVAGKTNFTNDVLKHSKPARECRSVESGNSCSDQREYLETEKFVDLNAAINKLSETTDVMSLKVANALLMKENEVLKRQELTTSTVNDATRVIIQLLREQLAQVKDELVRCTEEKQKVEQCLSGEIQQLKIQLEKAENDLLTERETVSKGQGQLELLLAQEQQLRQISTSQNIDLQRKLAAAESALMQEQQTHVITRRRLEEQEAFAERQSARLARQQQQQVTSSPTSCSCSIPLYRNCVRRQVVDDIIADSMMRAKHLLSGVTEVGGDADKGSSSNSPDPPPHPPALSSSSQKPK